MQIRVRPEADKGHVVGNDRFEPGEELPGEFDRVPTGLDHKLEPVPKGGTDKRIAEMHDRANRMRREADELDAKATALKAEEEQKLLDEAAKQREKDGKRQPGRDPEAALQAAREDLAVPRDAQGVPQRQPAPEAAEKGKR